MKKIIPLICFVILFSFQIVNAQKMLLVKAQEFEKAHNYQKALELYEKIYKMQDIDQSTGLYKIGEIYSIINSPDMANQYLMRYLHDYKNGKFSDYANYWIGNNYLWTKNPDYNMASSYFNNIISASNKSDLIIKSYYCLGVCYFKLKEWDDCKASFKKVIHASVQHTNEFYKMRNDASNKLSQLTDEVPKDYYNKGIAALDSFEYQKAYDYFNKIVVRKDENYYTQSVVKASWCKFQLKEYDNAYKLIKDKINYPKFSNDETFRYVYAICLIYKKHPEYSKAIERLKQLNLKEVPSKEYENLIYYYLGLCYEKKADKETFKDARDDYLLSKMSYQDFINKYPNDTNYSAAKKAIEKLKKKIHDLDQKIKDNKIFKFGDFFTYKKRTSKDTLIITIVDILTNSHLIKGEDPGLIYLPVNIDKVSINQKVKIIIEHSPFTGINALGYLNVTTKIPRSNLNRSKLSINIQVSQGYACCKTGNNKIEVEDQYGIWSDSYPAYSTVYKKPLTILLSVNSLGKSFRNGKLFSQKKESPLAISIFLSDFQHAAKDCIINAKKKGVQLLYISGM